MDRQALTAGWITMGRMHLNDRKPGHGSERALASTVESVRRRMPTNRHRRATPDALADAINPHCVLRGR